MHDDDIIIGAGEVVMVRGLVGKVLFDVRRKDDRVDIKLSSGHVTYVHPARVQFHNDRA